MQNKKFFEGLGNTLSIASSPDCKDASRIINNFMKKLCGDDLIYMVSQNILHLGISQKDGETLVLALLDNEANVKYIFKLETALVSSHLKSLDNVIDQNGKILSDVNLEPEAIVNYIKNSDDEAWISILKETKGLMLFASNDAIFTEVIEKAEMFSTLVSFVRVSMKFVILIGSKIVLNTK